MSLHQRRAEVLAQTRQVQALRSRGESHARSVGARVRTLWPWLWIGGGALLGAAVERDLDRRPRTRPGLSIAWLTALPWGVLIPWVERAMAASDRASGPPTHTGGDSGA